ncbi:STAS domain-containing protein [Streptomyces sp. NPDC051907]|uniref:STAS domain-containing protein n=1 Tax=Streptomyces sp. NPDC051907 TaxID=3155284 RepID=UPI0034135B10
MTETALLAAVVTRVGGKSTVSVAGEIDVATAPRLRGALSIALSHHSRWIEVDLARVDFCDCSGLSVLLWARGRARRQGSSLRVTGVTSPLVRKVFRKTGTDTALTEPEQG